VWILDPIPEIGMGRTDRTTMRRSWWYKNWTRVTIWWAAVFGREAGKSIAALCLRDTQKINVEHEPGGGSTAGTIAATHVYW